MKKGNKREPRYFKNMASPPEKGAVAGPVAGKVADVARVAENSKVTGFTVR